MTRYLAYAASGKEFEVEETLRERGFDVWCGRKVSFVRRGKKRRAEAVISPKLPNYVFLSLTPEEWHAMHSKPIKHMARTMYVLQTRDEKQLANFQYLVDAEHQEGLRVAERNDKAEMVQFEAGQDLVDLRGRFGEQALRFKRMVERAEDFPLIEAETEMMGRVVTVRLDPLDVKSYE
jgi:hypothetical protein